jgi:copper chaperone CopZ
MSTTTATFAVDGMTCNGCVKSVTHAIRQAPGVANVDVSLGDKRATVEYDPSTGSPAQIVDAIVGAGFEAKPA